MLTELEGDVLGFVWKLGPMTAYRVRKLFMDSPSSHWQASAGAIYPVVERLLKRKLLRSTARKQGRRSASMLSLTVAGKEALTVWIAPADPREIVAWTHDPARTRIHFLALLPARERRSFLRRIETLLVEQIQTYRDMEATDWNPVDFWDDVVLRGAREIQEARLKWVRWIIASLG